MTPKHIAHQGAYTKLTEVPTSHTDSGSAGRYVLIRRTAKTQDAFSDGGTPKQAYVCRKLVRKYASVGWEAELRMYLLNSMIFNSHML